MNGIIIEKPDKEVFKGLEFAYNSLEKGGSMPTVFNAANEKAVALFLAKKIKFLEIYDIINDCMENHSLIGCPTLEQIIDIQKEVEEYIDKRCRL